MLFSGRDAWSIPVTLFSLSLVDITAILTVNVVVDLPR